MSLFEDEYKTIGKHSEGSYKEKGSKFLAFALPAKSEEDVKEHLGRLRKEYHDARHHCYAYRLGSDKSAYRYNDDGEPSGTAGKPIYGQILSYDLTNILIVVIRYFGGTKLGVSGLINAYKSAARDALEEARIISKTIKDIYSIRFEYPLMNDIMRIIKDEELHIVRQDFQLSCELDLGVRKSRSTRIYDKFAGIHGVQIEYLKTV